MYDMDPRACGVNDGVLAMTCLLMDEDAIIGIGYGWGKLDRRPGKTNPRRRHGPANSLPDQCFAANRFQAGRGQ